MTETKPRHSLPHWKSGPPEIQRGVTKALTDTRLVTTNGEINVAAIGVEMALNYLRSRGFLWPSDEIPTPHTDAVAELKASGDDLAARQYEIAHGIDIKYERRSLRLAKNLELSATNTIAARDHRATIHLEAERERRIEERTRELTRQTIEKQAEKIRRQAEKEVG